MSAASVTFALNLALLIILAVVLTALKIACRQRLRTRHAETFESLGRPKWWPQKDVPTQFRWLKFAWGKEVETLNDPTLSRMYRIQRWAFVLYLLLLLVFSIRIVGGH
jgi:hypothetical protein